MQQIGLLRPVEMTIAYMTLRLDVVRGIPALTGDMRPQVVAGTPVPGGITFDGSDLVGIPEDFPALVSEA